MIRLNSTLFLLFVFLSIPGSASAGADIWNVFKPKDLLKHAIYMNNSESVATKLMKPDFSITAWITMQKAEKIAYITHLKKYAEVCYAEYYKYTPKSPHAELKYWLITGAIAATSTWQTVRRLRDAYGAYNMNNAYKSIVAGQIGAIFALTGSISGAMLFFRLETYKR